MVLGCRRGHYYLEMQHRYSVQKKAKLNQLRGPGGIQQYSDLCKGLPGQCLLFTSFAKRTLTALADKARLEKGGIMK